MKKIIFFIFFLIILLTNKVFAETIPIKQQLNDIIENVNIATQAKNVDKLVKYLPPHLLASMSLRLGKPVESLEQEFKTKINTQLKNDSIVKYSLNQKNVKISKTSDGQIFAIIPTIIENNKNIIHKQTLALYENNHWYIIYGGVQPAQNPLMALIYPSITEIHFKADKIIRK